MEVFEIGESKGNRIVKMLFALAAAEITFTFIHHLISALYNSFIGNVHPETHDKLPVQISLPFDQISYIGYVSAFIVEMMMSAGYVFVWAAIVGYFCSASYYIEACTVLIQNTISTIDKTSTAKERKKQLSELVKFHIKLIQ